MSKIRTQLANNEFYHIINRGVEERNIFQDDEDRFRFLNNLLVFNDSKPAPWDNRLSWGNPAKESSWLLNYKQTNPFVEIHAFALMDNHFHILLRQICENGIMNFMHKMGGYAYYFNKKYHRVGPLFQGRYKSVLVKDDEQLKNTFTYIHTNPVGLIESAWKEYRVQDLKKAINFIEKYPWSSYRDYLGIDNLNHLIIKDFFNNLFGSVDNIKEEVESWIQYKAQTSKMDEEISIL